MAIITGTKKHDYIDTKLVTAGVVGGFATDGDDVIRGLVGDDEIHAGGGNDTLIGDAGNDRLFGDAGNDYLDGGTKNDRLWGGDGEDVLNGGKGDDVMTGDADADVFVISDGNDIVTDFSPIVSHSAVVDFQDLLEGSPVPNVYSALIWPTAVNGFTVQDDGSGNLYAVNNLPSSGPALNAFAAQAGDFDLVSFSLARSLTPTPVGQLNVTIFAVDDGVIVGTVQINDVTDWQTITFGDAFKSIDRVSFSSSGDQFRLDDLQLVMHSEGEGDKLQVASAADVAALMASAVSDGAGNTILSQGKNSTTLLGVSSSDVSADWFTVV